jgi:hypothetical protein
MGPFLAYLFIFILSRYLHRSLKRKLIIPACAYQFPAERWFFQEKVFYRVVKKESLLFRLHFLVGDSVFLLLSGLFFVISAYHQPLPVTTTSNTSGERSLTARVLGLATRHCLTALPQDQYCHHTTEWATPVRDGHRYAIKFLASRDPGWRRYFVDERGGYYYTQYVLEHTQPCEEGPPLLHTEVSLVRESHLLRQLGDLQRSTGTRCICPSFLGILDNISFRLYHKPQTREESWLVMHDPVLYRVPSDARLVHTKPLYTESSPFYVFDPFPGKSLTHYDSFVVEFSVPDSPSQPLTTLTDYNNRLFEHGGGEKTFILQQLGQKSVARLRLQLSGDDASCFIYCQRLSGVPSSSSPSQ